jgi:hypothetical protein
MAPASSLNASPGRPSCSDRGGRSGVIPDPAHRGQLDLVAVNEVAGPIGQESTPLTGSHGTDGDPAVRPEKLILSPVAVWPDWQPQWLPQNFS